MASRLAAALVLYGEPGIGKSRLLAAAAEFARERGFTVLSTTGVQSEAHLAFAGLHQLLRPLRFHSANLPAAERAVLDAASGWARNRRRSDSGSRWPFLIC